MRNFPLTFDGNALHLIDGVDIYNYEFNTLPIRDLKSSKIARESLSVLNSADYVRKEIDVFAHVCGDNRAATEEAYGKLKMMTQANEAPMEVEQYGKDLEYICTLNSVSERWFGNKLIVQMRFIAHDPFGYEVEESTLLPNTVITASSVSESIEVGGTASGQAPVFTITINSVTGGASATISIKNEGQATGVSITRTWEENDVLVVDSNEIEVLVNGSSVIFSGRLPLFDPGIRAIGYEDTFDSRNVTLNAKYFKKHV